MRNEQGWVVLYLLMSERWVEVMRRPADTVNHIIDAEGIAIRAESPQEAT